MSMWYGDTSSAPLARRNHAGPMDACPGSPRKMKRYETCNTVWPSEFGWFLWNSDFIFEELPSGNLTGLLIDYLHIEDGDFPWLQGVQWYPSDISIGSWNPWLLSLWLSLVWWTQWEMILKITIVFGFKQNHPNHPLSWEVYDTFCFEMFLRRPWPPTLRAESLTPYLGSPVIKKVAVPEASWITRQNFTILFYKLNRLNI